jgi:hypothetical protein
LRQTDNLPHVCRPFGLLHHEISNARPRSRSLRHGLDPRHGRDILWSLTSRDLYCILVRDRGWTAQQYEEWLANTLVETLLRKEASGNS